MASLACVAVKSILDKLPQLTSESPYRMSADQVEKLESDLRVFNAFLKDSTKKRRKDESLKELVRQVRDLVYEAEDIVDALLTQAAGSMVMRFYQGFMTRLKLYSMARDIEKVSAKVKEYRQKACMIDSDSSLTFQGGPQESEAPKVSQDNVVGFEDEKEKLIAYLTEETQQLDVISIIGIPGLGKTTLVGKIFNDPAILEEFPTRICVCVSQKFRRKDIFLAILRKLTRLDEYMYHKSDQELARLVESHLETGKFLIVMDDVWTVVDWEKLQIALPKSNNMGKVLITTRHLDVAKYVNRNRHPHKLRFLTQEESWLLLCLKVFGTPICPPELEDPGKLIANQCDGLPLAIVVIGDILVKENSESDDMSSRREVWTKVSKSVTTCLSEDPERRMQKNIALSYDKLPYHLRACFLYLGMFPEDFEIPIGKLIRIWIAEGFIQEKTGTSLEETAEKYLEDLINRNLVRVEKMRPDGIVKTCRIHDMVRDFCIKEAGNENFLQELKSSIYHEFEPSIAKLKKFRRLCIHSNVLNFNYSKSWGRCVRSFVCFSKEEVSLPKKQMATFPKAFKLLRVIEAKPIKFPKIPSYMSKMVHLRYLTLSFNLAILPASFSKLSSIQTLIVDTTSQTLTIEANIWNMVQLRYLKTNAATTLPETGEGSKECDNLCTLGTISPHSCTKEVFKKARNLKKLGIRGHLALLLEGQNGSFDSLGKLENLGKLKLLNDVFPRLPLEGQLQGLPPPYKFPPKLRSLTLSATLLDWSHMSILGLLENLEALKLKDNAFMGKHWKATDGGFRRLELLHIGRTDLVFWIASAHHFPRLRCLELHNCEELKEIPIGLAEIPSFQVLDLYHTKSAATFAKKIGEIKKQEEKQNDRAGRFMLAIFPVDE